jgi:hypothetical protein
MVELIRINLVLEEKLEQCEGIFERDEFWIHKILVLKKKKVANF